MSLTTDPKNPCLDETRADGQQECYLVLSKEERSKGFVNPVRYTYLHKKCFKTTTMGDALAETWARDPNFYGATYCCNCGTHLPVGEFTWLDGSAVGSAPNCRIFVDAQAHTVKQASMRGYEIKALTGKKNPPDNLFELDDQSVKKTITDFERVMMREGLNLFTTPFISSHYYLQHCKGSTDSVKGANMDGS